MAERSGMPPLEASSPFDLKDEEMTHEMVRVDREMTFLEELEALLNKSQQLCEKRLALDEKKNESDKIARYEHIYR